MSPLDETTHPSGTHPPTPPRRVTVGQSEPSDPPVFPLPGTGGSVFAPSEDAALRHELAAVHLGVDRHVVRAMAVAGGARRIEGLVGAQHVMSGVVEVLTGDVHEL
jgi:hypothetical protein